MIHQRVSFGSRRLMIHQMRMASHIQSAKALALASMIACSAGRRPEPESFTIEAVPVGYPSLAGVPGLAFAVGLRTELRVFDSTGEEWMLVKSVCTSGCLVES